jgi:hypothetical protein
MVSDNGEIDDREGEERVPTTETPMTTKDKFPHDSIKELVEFFDTHDMTDYEDEFETVEEPALESGDTIMVDLPATEAEAVRELAKSKGITETELVREWVLERIHAA